MDVVKRTIDLNDKKNHKKLHNSHGVKSLKLVSISILFN
jgi:hypothetical protein